MYDVFISYSRRDSEFMRRLVASLEAHGRNVWVDFDDIPFATDWWEEIVQGIENSRVAVFVISPDSLKSQVCSLELAHILKVNKRLIPIVVREEPNGVSDSALLAPKRIMALNWIFFTDPDKYNQSFAKLLETLDTDIERQRANTQLLLKAREWERRGRVTAFLLNRQQMDEFTQKLADIPLTPLQEAFLTTSRAHNHLMQIVRRFGWGFLMGALGMVYVIVSTFRGDTLVQPLTIALAIAAGEIFGGFVGALAMLSYGLPTALERLIPRRLRLGFRVVAAFAIGVFAWMVYQWLFLQIGFSLTYATFIGGVGLALGFVLPMFIVLPSLWRVVMAWAATFTPIYLLNNLSPLEVIQDGRLNPLIYFDDPTHPLVVGAPLALFIALASIEPDLLVFLWSRAEAVVRKVLLQRFQWRNSIERKKNL